jgi:DNA-binding MarR family transcriptional regulator
MSSVDGSGPAGDVRWLDAAERQAWLHLAAVLFRLPGALDAQLQRDADLTQFEYLVLAHLSESPGRSVRMTALADLANGSPSRLSHVVGRLERRGLVERRTAPADGRSTLAVLTCAGWEKVVATAPGHVARVRELVVDALDADELAQLRSACAKILARVDGPAIDWGDPVGGRPRGPAGSGRPAGGGGPDPEV